MQKVVKPKDLEKALEELYGEFHIELIEHGHSWVTITYKEVTCSSCSENQLKPVRMKKHGFVREGDITMSSFICPLCKQQELVRDEYK